MNFAQNYAGRLIGFILFMTVICGLMFGLFYYADAINETVKTIMIVIIGLFAEPATTAFKRIADPAANDLTKYEEEIQKLRSEIHELRIETNARDEEQRRIINLLLARDEEQKNPSLKITKQKGTN